MKKIAIVARVSTVDKQDYARQINDLTKVILQHNHKLEDIEIFADKISGYSKNEDRPEFSRLLENLNDYKCIYVTEISRLGRNPAQVRKTIDEIDNLKIPIYIQSLNQFTINSEGKRDYIMQIVIQIVMELSNAESEQMKVRSKSGLLNSARSGRAGGGASIAYGYEKDTNKMLVVNEDEAKVIRRIFDLYSKKNGIRVISNLLNAEKVPTRSELHYKKAGKGWQEAVVLGIIKNTLYKGERNFKGEILQAPAIICQELFDSCQEVRETKTHRNYDTKYTYLLKDIVKCGCCGKNYLGRYKPTPNGDKIYMCTSRLKKGGSCENKGVNIALIESVLYNELLKEDFIMKYFRNANDVRVKLKEDIALLRNTLKSDKEKQFKKLKEKERLFKAYMAEAIDLEKFTLEDGKLKSMIENLNEKISRQNILITETTKVLKKQSNSVARNEFLMKLFGNRIELQRVFSELIDKVLVTDLSPKLMMLNVTYKVNDIRSASSTIILNKGGIFLKKKKYQYIQTENLDRLLQFDNEILVSSTEEILEELKQIEINSRWNDLIDENIIIMSL